MILSDHFIRTILSVPFCPLPFCPTTKISAHSLNCKHAGHNIVKALGPYFRKSTSSTEQKYVLWPTGYQVTHLFIQNSASAYSSLEIEHMFHRFSFVKLI